MTGLIHETPMTTTTTTELKTAVHGRQDRMAVSAAAVAAAAAEVADEVEDERKC